MVRVKTWKKIFILSLTFVFLFSIFNIGKVLASEPLFKLTNAKISEKNDGVKANIVSFNDTSVDINAEFHKLNDYIIYELTIKNNTDKNYTIKSVSDNNNNAYINYLYDNYEGVEIKANDSVLLVVKSVYQNEVTDITKRDQEDSLKISLTLADEEGNIIDEDISVNPKTNDNIMFYVVLGGTSLFLLISLIAIKSKKTRNIIVFVLVLTPFIAKAISSSIVITITNEIKLYDKIVTTEDILGEKVIKVMPYGSKVVKPADPVKDGYTFVGWYNGSEEFDFDKEYTEDVNLTAKFNLIPYNISYELNGGTLNNSITSYNVETSTFSLGTPTKKGYVFAGWTGSNGSSLQTYVEISKGTTGDKQYVAHFTEGTETPYKVIHKYANLDGSYETVTQNLKGVTNSKVTPAALSKYGFNDPTLTEIEISAEGNSSVTYIYTRKDYTFSYNSDVETTFTNSSYPYETPITVTAKSKTGYSLSKWSNNSILNPLVFSLTADTYIYPIYEPNTYTVTYHSNLDIDSTTQEGFIYDTSKNLKNNAFVNQGYTFSNWATSPDGTGNTYTDGEEVLNLATNGNVDLYAIWNPRTDITYTVYHKYQNLNGSYDIDTQSLTGTTNAPVTPSVISRDGFNNPEVQTKNIKADGSTSFEYIYTRKEVILTINSDVTGDFSTGSYLYGTEITLSPITKEGYTFTKWNNDSTSNPLVFNITGNIELYPIYTTNSYTVTFNANDGSGNTSVQNFVYDAAQNLNNNSFNNVGYMFAGWNTKADGSGTSYANGVEVLNLASSGNIDLYAIWTPNTNTAYTVYHKYEQLDGNYELVTVPLTGTTGTYVTPDLSPRNGFVSPTPTELYIKGDGTASLTYTYNREEYTLTVNSDVETTFTEPKYKYGTEITLNAKSKDGYTFTKWNNNETSNPLVFNIVSNTSLYPIYTANTYQVMFDPNGGTGGVLIQTFTYDQGQNLYTTSSTRTGYTYDGWTINSDGTGDSYSEGQYVINLITSGTLTLYAKWIPNTYTVTFHANNETGDTLTQTFTYDVADYLSANTFTYANHEFDGWTTNSDGTGDSYTDGESVINLATTGNVDLYAKWSVIPPICKKASSLNTTTCQRTDSKGCKLISYTQNDPITYGNIAYNYTSGDAYDCDVNGDGTYDANLERFYYLRTVDDKAVLIYNNHLGDVGQIDNGLTTIGQMTITEARGYLPTSAMWSNVPEISTGVITRFISEDDITAACHNASPIMSGCIYTLENTGFQTSNSALGRSAVWMEPVSTSTGMVAKRYRGDTLVIAELDSYDYKSQNGIRPVIEIPLERMDPRYTIIFDSNGGNEDNTFRFINDGSSFVTLPTVSKTNAVFLGWFTAEDGGTQISVDTVPTADTTYYAHYAHSVDHADIVNENIHAHPGDDVQILINNEEHVETRTYASSDNTIATVSDTGLIHCNELGDTTVIITGDISGTTRVINIHVVTDIVNHTVTFESNGGTEYSPAEVAEGSVLSPVPTPTKSEMLFDAWYLDEELTDLFDPTIPIYNDVKIYAKYYNQNDVARIGHSYYATIAAAVAAVETSDKTTIHVIKDSTSDAVVTIPTGRHIDLQLDGHTYELTAGTNVSTNVFMVNGQLDITGGTVKSKAKAGILNVESGGILNITGGTYQATGSRQVLYNKGSTATISGNAILTSTSAERATVHNLENGTTYILGGTIKSTGTLSTAIATQNKSHAVVNESGTVYIGEQGGSPSTASPVIQGGTTGVFGSNVYFYDGIIKGYGASFGTVPDSSKIESGYEIIDDNETISGTNYHTAILGQNANTYVITLDPNGGEVTPTALVVNQGDDLTGLPDPIRNNFTFDGWFNGDNEQITSSTIPSSNFTIHARWTYNASDEIVSFRTTNNAMKTYYSYINSWKSSSSNFPTWSNSNKSPDFALDATENTAMKNNFDANNCMCADGQCSSSGTVMCDKPKGYDTGFNESVTVRLSDVSTKTKTGEVVTYAKSSNGVIYNLIPGEVYYWELDSDSSVYGYVTFTGERRIIDAGDVRNVRDLGGLPVDLDGDNVIDGHVAYGRLFRGIRLNSSSSVTELTNLGINSELDLREANSDTNQISRYNRIEAQNYFVDPTTGNQTELTYYTMTRNAVKYAMQEIVDKSGGVDKNLYFHCRIGTDRTGTVAWVLEGLLGVPEEDRIEDYELSFFYGLIRIHRYHNQKPGSSVGTGYERFTYMHNFMPTNSDIYDWYMYGSTNTAEDIALINAFRAEMIVHD